MTSRLRTSRRQALRIAAALCALVPVSIAWAQELRDGQNQSRPASNTDPADDPPPLRFDHKPVAPVPVDQERKLMMRLYASEITHRVYMLITQDKDHRFENGFKADLKLWISPEGRVTQAQLAPSSNGAALDKAFCDAVRTEVFPPPPKGLPMPANVVIGRGRIGGYSSSLGARRIEKSFGHEQQY